MHDTLKTLDEAVCIIKEQTAALRTVLSVEPLGANKVLLATIHGPLVFFVGRSPDGRIELVEEPAGSIPN